MAQNKPRNYVVTIREIWHQDVAVEASSPDEAKQKVLDADGDYLDDCLTYSHMDREHPIVEVNES